MSWFKWPRKKIEALHVAQVRFLGEQDGPPERELKEKLAEFFRDSTVKSAYLAQVAYESGAAPEVALCIRSESGPDESLAKDVGSVFARMFGKGEHMDIVFLDEGQEAELSKVCRAFFAVDGFDDVAG
jgi:hypothetical protein